MENEKPESKSNYAKYMSNPRCFTLKKWFAELLKKNYMQHDEIVERVSTSLLTDKDVESFGKVVMSVYEAGYKKAVEDYRSQFEKMGVKINIGQEEIN